MEFEKKKNFSSLFQHHHRHQHHKGAADTVSLGSSHLERSSADGVLNGERSSYRSSGRRGVSGAGSGTYGRRDSVESPPQRSLESPRPQRTLAMDLHTHRGSLDNVPTRILYKHDGYSQDDLIGYAHETSPRGYQDVSQITAVQVTPRPKPRAFPRTNPAYVGVHRRDGAPSYKKINIETSTPPTAIYNQRFYEAHAHPPPHPSFDTVGMQTSTASIQTTQPGYHGESEGSGRAHLLYGRHDRSDSDTSHSSYGRIPSEMTDSLVSQSSGQLKGGLGSGGGGGGGSHRDHSHSDSHSSQGSLRNIQDSHSSQGSLRSSHERDHVHEVSSSSHSSPRHHFNNNMVDITANNTPVDNKNVKTTTTSVNVNNKSKHSQPTSVTQKQQQQTRALTRHNSEPDYANLPIVAHVKEGKILTLDSEPVIKDQQQQQQDKLSSRSTGDSGKGRSEGPGQDEGLSPQEFGRQDTPSSIRSHSTQNSTSHTSEGTTRCFCFRVSRNLHAFQVP